MRLASATAEGLGKELHADTPENPGEAVGIFTRLVDELRGTERVEAVVGGIPGLPDPDGVILTAPNLPAWRGFPLGAELERRISAPVRVYHDSDIGGLGEAIYGAGNGYDIVMYVAVGTGVGCSRIVRGAFDAYAVGFEAGHQIIEVGRALSLEGAVSGRAVSERFGVHPKDAPPEAYEEMTPILAAGLYNTALHWSPDIIVLGGSMVYGVNGFNVERVAAEYARLPALFPRMPQIVPALLNGNAGLHGARALLMSHSI